MKKLSSSYIGYIIEIMKKTPKCKSCKEDGHYAISCRKTPRKPIQSRSVKPKAVKAKTTKPKTKPRSWYIKKLDIAYSKYIRLLKSDSWGYCICVTCGNKLYWKEMQNGHFISRGKYPTRWLDDNCWPQDYRCNVALKGNYIEYTLFMISKFGVDGVEELKQKSTISKKIPTSVLSDITAHYKEKVKELKAQKLDK